MSDKPTISERYSRAVDASDLTVAEHSPVSDVLIAAGIASQGDPRKNVALALWRMRQGDLDQFAVVSGVLGSWLLGKGERERFKTGGRHMYERVVSRTVFWWIDSHCRHCDGRGHPTIPGTPILDETRDCPHCLGTGITPLESMVQQDYIYAAKTLANEMDRITSDVFAEMRRRLRSEA